MSTRKCEVDGTISLFTKGFQTFIMFILFFSYQCVQWHWEGQTCGSYMVVNVILQQYLVTLWFSYFHEAVILFGKSWN